VTEAMAVRHPVLQVVEDVHWADSSTLDLVRHMIERCRSTAALHVITFRPDFSPPWPASANVAALTLSNLSKSESEASIDRVTEQRPLPEALRHRILERTDGVPLFVEELTKSVLESGALSEIDGRLTLIDQSSELRIPESLQDSLMARLDRLSAGRDLVQLAAAIGRRFSHDLLSATSDMEEPVLASKLKSLMEAGLIHRLGVPPHANYEFQHALVQEAAYESLLRATRRTLHARIAEVLRERFPDTGRAHPELLARHCALGGLSEQAVALWRQAGQMAMQRAAHREAVACFEAALSTLEELEDTTEKMQHGIDLRLRIRTALFATGELARMYTYLDEADGIAARLGDDRQVAKINVHKAWALGFQGSSAGAIESAEAARLIAENLHDRPLSALADTVLGWIYVITGPSRQAVEHLNGAMNVLSQDLLHDRMDQTGVRSVFALSNIAIAKASLGEFSEAIVAGEKAVEIARQVDHPYDISYSEWCLGAALLSQGEVDDAIPHLDVAFRDSRANGIRVVAAWALGELGRAYLLLDQVPDSVSCIEQALELARETGNKRTIVSLTAYLANAYRCSGALDVARPLAAEALDTCREYGFRVLEPAALRLTSVLDVVTPDNTAGPLSRLNESVAIAKRLELYPDMAHSHLALAAVHRDFDRVEDAAREQCLAIRLYRRMNMEYWIERAKALEIPDSA